MLHSTIIVCLGFFFFDNRGIRSFAFTGSPGHRAKRPLHMGRIKLRRSPACVACICLGYDLNKRYYEIMIYLGYLCKHTCYKYMLT